MTGPPEFRNPNLFQVLPHRDYIRQRCPMGSNGFVVEDLDLVQRVYGQRFNLDGTGRFRLIEYKHGHAGLDVAQINTFGLMDQLLHRGDWAGRYAGFYVVNTTCADWADTACEFTVNGVHLSHAEFDAWLVWERDVPPRINWNGR